MKILFVVAHPNVDKSFNHKLVEEGGNHLKSLKHEVEVVDLYKLSYHPLIRDKEERQMTEQLEKLVWSEFIIIQFPLYWFSCPSILKGYIDYLMPLCAQENKSSEFLWGKKRKVMISVTTGGPYRDAVMDAFLAHILNQIKECGFELVKSCYHFGVNFAKEEKRKKFITNMKKRLGEIEEKETESEKKT